MYQLALVVARGAMTPEFAATLANGVARDSFLLLLFIYFI
jgi:hypothetical protein